MEILRHPRRRAEAVISAIHVGEAIGDEDRGKEPEPAASRGMGRTVGHIALRTHRLRLTEIMGCGSRRMPAYTLRHRNYMPNFGGRTLAPAPSPAAMPTATMSTADMSTAAASTVRKRRH